MGDVNLETVTCDMTGTILFDKEDYVSSLVNYEAHYVVCPPGCGTDAKVFGRSIYAPESLVCAAGIADGSIPAIGGVLGVFI